MENLIPVGRIRARPSRRGNCASVMALRLSPTADRYHVFVFRRSLAQLTCLLVLLCVAVRLQANQLDERALQALHPGHVAVRWDNVEGPPQWICGSKPIRARSLGLHLVHLLPGESVTFKVPPRAIVRVMSPHQQLEPEAVELWISNGTGLYRQQLNGVSTCDTSLLAVPDGSHTSLARVVRPGSCDGAIALAIFTSRLDLPEVVDGYRHELHGCGPKVALHDAHRTGKKHFYCLQPGRPARFAVSGPARLAIETRLRYQHAEARMFQAYQLVVCGDDMLRKVLEYETSSELRQRVRVKGREEVLGRLETAYLDVPPGDHQLHLDGMANLLVRIGSTHGREYLLPKFNRPPWLATAQSVNPAPQDWVSIWDIQPEQVHNRIYGVPQAATAHEPIALRSARDNRYREGGLHSMMLMRAAAGARPDYREIRTVADKLRGFHTFFRNLLPAQTVDRCAQRVAWFHTRRLRDPGEPLPSVVLAEQHIEDALDGLSRAHFLTLPASRESAHQFRLPADLGTSLLRVVVDRGSLRATTRIMLQYDDRPPVQLDARATNELPTSQFVPSRAEAALTALSWQHGDYHAGTLGGPFSPDRNPGDLVNVATNELIVPAGVKEVRVWAESACAENVMMALQYRASRRYRLSESQYLELFRRTAADHQALFTALSIVAQPMDPGPRGSLASTGLPVGALRSLATQGPMGKKVPDDSMLFAHQELRNHWLPFVWFLRAHQQLFAAGVKRDPLRSAAVEPMAEPHRRRQFDEAVRLTDQKLWLPALEAWSELLPHLTGAARRQALFARVSALEELQEMFLAERKLRAMYLFDRDPQVRREACERMRQFHRRRGDRDAEEQLLAAAAVREPTSERLAELAAVLVENGHYEYALTAALAVPPPQRPVPVVVRAAYKMRWWKVFHDAVWQLPDEQQRFYWLAQRHLTLGDYAEALDHFAGAGQRGQTIARHLRDGQQIHAMLRDPDAATRANAVFAWERWQAAHPGPRTWREDGSLVNSYAGSEAVYSINRDSYAQHYTAQADRPLSLSVLGPVRLKFEARPIRHRADEAPLDDMFYVRAPGRQYVFPINGNHASMGLQIVGDPLHVPGRAVNAELDLGPGLHEMEVVADKMDLLVRVFVQRPETPLPVLPPLGGDALDAVLAGQYGMMIKCDHRTHVHLLPSCNEKPVDRLLVRQTVEYERSANRSCDGLNALLAARLTLRTGQSLHPHAEVLLNWAANIEAGCDREKILAVARLEQMPWLQQTLSAGGWQIPSAEHLAIDVASGNYESALDVVCDDDPDALLQRMALLVKLAESDDGQKLRCAVLGNQLATRYPNLPGLAQSALRITRFGTWTPYREVSASSGLHGKSIEGWLPEAPSLRVRKALLSNLRRGDNLLAGYQRLILAMQNPRPTALELSLFQSQIASLQSSAVVVNWQLDDGPSHPILLASVDSVRSIRVEVPQGAHRLRLWLDQPLANQYVVVRAHEALSTGPPVTRSEDRQLVRQIERLYHVATQVQSVRFRVDGPALIRIDQLDGETTVCRHMTITEGTRVLDLRPLPGDDTALFRIFEYRLDRHKKVPPTAIVSVEPEPLPAPLIDAPLAEEILPGEAANESWLRDIPLAWGEPLVPLSLLSADAAPELVQLNDSLPLGGQEDGTWALGMGLVSRRPLDEGINGAAPDRFMEGAVTYRYYDSWRSSYKKTELLFRLREQSGPTFGLRHGYWHKSNHLPFNVGWNGFAYFQRPSDPIPPAEERTEWSLGVGARLWQSYDLSPDWYHVPSLYAFGRWLSRERPVYEPGRVDQNIFTTYKADHRTGMRLWDTFVFTPWHDARWWFRPALVTNEDYDLTRPDHVYLRVGRSQMIGLCTVDVSYRIAEFYQDEDRPRDSIQHILALEGLAEHFTLAGRRCELGIGVAHDLSIGKTSAILGLSAYFDNGRRYRDVYSGDDRFLALRKQNALQRVAQRAWREN